MNNTASFDIADSVAIVGMAGRFPGARNVDDFWHNIRDGKETITFFTDQELIAAGVDAEMLADPHYVKAHGRLKGIEDFDADFFGYTRKEAEILCPQQRLFLETAWEALENAGYDPEKFDGDIGVYAGAGLSGYMLRNIARNDAIIGLVGEMQIAISTDKDYLPMRVSYKLNLTGPSVNVNTACSTSLTAVHLAAQALLNYQCDMALAGGVTLQIFQDQGYRFVEGGIVSPDGHCRTFDAKAQGTLGGSGVGIVTLKRLEDALTDGDRIYAVIRGSAINNDGSAKVGFTAPSVEGQMRVIAEAQAAAGITPEDISYIEAHGTATPIGDPIEIEALTLAFRAATDRKGFCAIGSVKSNFGHCDAAAGIAGLLKTVKALEHKQVPPSLHFEQPNPNIDFANSPVYVNSELVDWQTEDGRPRLAGVSSFGIGGTNAHVILQEPPESQPADPGRPWRLLPVSARTPSALDTACDNLAQLFREQPNVDLSDATFTLAIGRKAFEHRRFVVACDANDAAEILARRDPERVFENQTEPVERRVAFLFSGQGSQYVGMAKRLYEFEPSYRKNFDRCTELLQQTTGLDLREIVLAQPDAADKAELELRQTAIAQPALFVLEYALAQMWISWGVKPSIMLGHSIGEYTAACIAGVFTLEDALTLVTERGRLMQSMPQGAMLSVSLPAREVEALMGPHVSIAALNGPELCVASGPAEEIARLMGQLESRDIKCRKLLTSHAFHSAMMEPVMEKFAAVVDDIALKAPQIPCISNVTGTPLTDEQATDPAYWTAQLRNVVNFESGLQEIFADPHCVLLEVGPGRSLSSLAMGNPAKPHASITLASLPHPHDTTPDDAFVQGALGKLWLAGVPISWQAYYADERRRRIPLPTYPFERRRYWIDLPESDLRTRNGATYSQTLSEQRKDENAATQEALSQQLPYNGNGSAASSTQQSQKPASSDESQLDDRPQLATTYTPPRTADETAIAQLWTKLLGIRRIGVFDDFFELGGHSLLATQALSHIRQLYNVELPISKFFERATIDGLVRAIDAERLSSSAAGADLDSEIGEDEEEWEI